MDIDYALGSWAWQCVGKIKAGISGFFKSAVGVFRRGRGEDKGESGCGGEQTCQEDDTMMHDGFGPQVSSTSTPY